MKMNQAAWIVMSGALTMASVPGLATTYDLHKNDVIPIKFETKVSTANAKVGDKIKAVVESDSELPKGTLFLGHVDKAKSATKDHNGVLDLSFDQIKFKNGTIVPIQAVPIPLDKKYVDKLKNGQYVGKPVITKGTALGAGALAGFLLGSLINKPFEGTFLGSLIGVVVGETNGGPQQATINKGKELGAFVQQDITLDDTPTNSNAALAGPSASQKGDSNNNQGQYPIDPTGPVNPQSVVINGIQLHFAAGSQPFKVGNSVMVPLRSASDQLGLHITDGTEYIYVDSQSHSMRIAKGTAQYRLDGNAKTASTSPIIKDGAMYVPVDMLNAVVASN